MLFRSVVVDSFFAPCHFGEVAEVRVIGTSPLCIPSFGIGTHFTNDFPGMPHLNIVIKLVASKITESWPFFNDTCKLSEDSGKHSGKPEVVKRFLAILHMEE